MSDLQVTQDESRKFYGDSISRTELRVPCTSVKDFGTSNVTIGEGAKSPKSPSKVFRRGRGVQFVGLPTLTRFLFIYVNVSCNCFMCEFTLKKRSVFLFKNEKSFSFPRNFL